MKYLFSILLVFSCFFLNAQRNYTFTGSDTITNAATVDVTLIVSGSYDAGTFQVINTKLSGTGAGTSYLQGSVDGTNYITMDSLAHTNVTVSTGSFILALPKYPYYRVRTIGSGTMSVITTTIAHFKKL